MTVDPSRPAGSSTSPPRPSPPSRRSGGGSSTSASPGSPDGLGVAAIRALAARHGVRPSKELGQHFLIDPNLARAIAADAFLGPGDRVVEVGAGLGSLTLALAGTGAEVLAIEFDRALIPALRETVGGASNVRVLQADATKLDWIGETGQGPWTLCANLPYNVAVQVVLDVLEHAPSAKRLVVMVQREVGGRFVAVPGETHYGPVSLRIAYRARGSTVRRVPREVFWPRPTVASVVVRLERLPKVAVDADETRLWGVVEAGFAERRKTIRSAVIRLGVDRGRADDLLATSGVSPRARAEELSLQDFARIAEAIT